MSSSAFTVSYDSTAKTITTAVFVMLLALGLATGSIAVGVVFVLILAASFGWAPTGYSIGEGLLVVHRVAGNVRIPLAGIREVRVAAPEDLQGSIRIFGSGGMFGYYGVFRTSKLGKSTWYVTNKNHAVVVVTSAGPLLFSPDDVDGFVGWTRPVGSPLPARFAPVTAEPTRPVAAWVTAVVVVGATALALVGLFYSPGPPAYTLTNDTLTIQDRFYPVKLTAESVDVKNVRVIDFSQDTDWKPVARTNGFGNAHYHSGFFRVASGDEVRLYRADGTRMILLPAKNGGEPVLLETREPTKFLEELYKKWAVVPEVERNLGLAPSGQARELH